MSGKIQVEAKIVEHGKGQYVINYGAYYQSESDDYTSIEKATHFTFVAATNYFEQSYPANSVWHGHWKNRNGENVYLFDASI